MRVLICAVFFLSCLYAGYGFAGEIQQVELKDGSVISGEVISLKGGVYTIHSGTLGDLRVDQAKIKAIHSGDAAARGDAAAGPGLGSDLQEIVIMMMQDKETMNTVLSLQNDPDFKRAVEDPELMDAIRRGDTADLSENPNFIKLLNNPKIRQIVDKSEN